MKDKAYRDAYVASQIRIAIPMQIRALRKSRQLSQPELAKLSGMAQPRISEIETPGERRPNIETLLRLAAALDVGLEVKFVPFDQLIDDSDNVDLDNFSIKTFDEIMQDEEKYMGKSMTIITIANEITVLALSIWRRASGIADALGGLHPECNQQETPQPSDLHSVLQRARTILEETKAELARSERVIGVCGDEPINKTVTGRTTSFARTAMGKMTTY